MIKSRVGDIQKSPAGRVTKILPASFQLLAGTAIQFCCARLRYSQNPLRGSLVSLMGMVLCPIRGCTRWNRSRPMHTSADSDADIGMLRRDKVDRPADCTWIRRRAEAGDAAGPYVRRKA